MRKHPVVEQGSKVAKDEAKRNGGVQPLWELVKPVDFEGEDTSLTQEQLALLK
jgi:hypothetical protein